MGDRSSLAAELENRRARSGEWGVLFDGLIESLRRIGAGASSPAVGEPFPAFSLPDAAGRYRSLDSLVAEGPLVLSFNRGGWCPYCTSELSAWNDMLPALAGAGGHLAVVTPEIGGRAALLSGLLHGDSEILCDVDHGVALACGLAFYLGETVLTRYRNVGFDIGDHYGSSSGFLPIPATYVVDGGGVVRYAFADPDFRVRAEPADVIDAVRDLMR